MINTSMKALQNKIILTQREGKLRHFYSLFADGMTVVDVGVSPQRKKRIPTTNYFLKNFKYESMYYTGLGVRDLSQMRKHYPDKTFVQYPGGRFPFKDNEFDWAFSNAVIEHVGGEATELHFLNEMLRVAKNVFFTTPNKHFPIEVHTNALFLHWNNAIFYRWCRSYRKGITKDNLYLFSYTRLKELLDSSNACSYEIRKNRLIGIPMTYTVVCD